MENLLVIPNDWWHSAIALIENTIIGLYWKRANGIR